MCRYPSNSAAYELCTSKAYDFVKQVEALITPRDMYLIGCLGGYHNSYELVYDWPHGFVLLLDEICDSFRVFNEWLYMRTPGLPNTDAELAEKANEWAPYRKLLLDQVHDRIFEYAWTHEDEIVQYYREKAMSRWRSVTQYVKLQSIVMYWVHVANMPLATGYYSGLREIEADLEALE